jgi:hypothetical protein
MQVRAVPNARLLFRHKETSLHNDKHTSTDLPLHSVQSFPPLVRASVAAAARPTPPAESRPRVALPVRHAPAYVPQLRMILLQELSLQLLHFFSSMQPPSLLGLQTFWLHMKPLFQLFRSAYLAVPFQATLDNSYARASK